MQQTLDNVHYWQNQTTVADMYTPKSSTNSGDCSRQRSVSWNSKFHRILQSLQHDIFEGHKWIHPSTRSWTTEGDVDEYINLNIGPHFTNLNPLVGKWQLCPKYDLQQFTFEMMCLSCIGDYQCCPEVHVTSQLVGIATWITRRTMSKMESNCQECSL